LTCRPVPAGLKTPFPGIIGGMASPKLRQFGREGWVVAQDFGNFGPELAKNEPKLKGWPIRQNRLCKAGLLVQIT